MPVILKTMCCLLLWSNTTFTFLGIVAVNACQMHLFNMHVVAPKACKLYELEEETSSRVLCQNKNPAAPQIKRLLYKYRELWELLLLAEF